MSNFFCRMEDEITCLRNDYLIRENNVFHEGMKYTIISQKEEIKTQFPALEPSFASVEAVFESREKMFVLYSKASLQLLTSAWMSVIFSTKEKPYHNLL